MNEQYSDGQEQEQEESPKASEYGSPCFQRGSQHPEPGMPELSAEAVSVWYRRAGCISKRLGVRAECGGLIPKALVSGKILGTVVMERVGQATSRDREAVCKLQGSLSSAVDLGMKRKQQPRALGLWGDGEGGWGREALTHLRGAPGAWTPQIELRAFTARRGDPFFAAHRELQGSAWISHLPPQPPNGMM